MSRERDGRDERELKQQSGDTPSGLAETSVQVCPTCGRGPGYVIGTVDESKVFRINDAEQLLATLGPGSKQEVPQMTLAEAQRENSYEEHSVGITSSEQTHECPSCKKPLCASEVGMYCANGECDYIDGVSKKMPRSIARAGEFDARAEAAKAAEQVYVEALKFELLEGPGEEFTEYRHERAEAVIIRFLQRAYAAGFAASVPVCPECGTDLTKGHHSRLQGCFPADGWQTELRELAAKWRYHSDHYAGVVSATSLDTLKTCADELEDALASMPTESGKEVLDDSTSPARTD